MNAHFTRPEAYLRRPAANDAAEITAADNAEALGWSLLFAVAIGGFVAGSLVTAGVFIALAGMLGL